MKKLLLAIMASCLLAVTASADIGPPGTVDSTVNGVSVDNALACYATNLDSESKALYKRWAELNVKMLDGTLTEEEYMEGTFLVQTGQCFNIAGGIEATVVLLDGHDYLVDYCLEGLDCIRVIQKSTGIDEG